MNRPPSLTTLGMKTSNPFVSPLFANAIKAAKPAQATSPLSVKSLTDSFKPYNPFMVALKNDSAEFKSVYGVNKPLENPMFIGYYDNKPIYGGNRLFILY
jgi:hypothetical protein